MSEILSLCSVVLNKQICCEMLKALPFHRTFAVICSVKDMGKGRGEEKEERGCEKTMRLIADSDTNPLLFS